MKRKQPKRNRMDQPATQRDLEVWGGELTRRIDRVEENMVTKADLTTAIKKSEERLIFEFKALAEIVMRDVGAVNRDEIESLKDADQKLDERVTVLEHKATVAR